MKKFLLVLSLVSTLLLVGCSNKENVPDNSADDNSENIQQGVSDNEMGRQEEEKDEPILKNKFVVKKLKTVTYKNAEMSEDMDSFGMYTTYNLITIENPNQNSSIEKMNQFLSSLSSGVEVELPELSEAEAFTQVFHESFEEYFQNDRVIVILEHWGGAHGGGGAAAYDTYYVFDKETGERLTINDITKNVDELLEFIYYYPTKSDISEIDGEYTNWWWIGTENAYGGMPRSLDEFKEYIEGHWAISGHEIVISQNYSLSGIGRVLKYNLLDDNNGGSLYSLKENLNEEFFVK